MKNFYYDKVNIKDGFWEKKQRLNEEVAINAVYDRFFDTGRIEAFKMNWKDGMEKKPHFFWDSDVAKWIEGASYILKKKNDPELSAKVESIIDDIEKNQGDDGYFNIYFTVCEPEGRFKNRDCHELYCAGHLFEAAVAYFEATGKDRFLRYMEKYADYIYKVFIEEKSSEFITPGHEEIELALLRLYRITKNKKHLELCKFFIDNRGKKVNYQKDLKSIGDEIRFGNSIYDQNHIPVRKQTEAVGHSVRACYLYTAMADLAFETNDIELKNACKKIFSDIVNKKMYITGGLGSSAYGEKFTIPYDLPNETAYAETCASIAMIFFASKMLQLENKAIYADIIEKELYNGMLSGLSLDGKKFFYENPLEINMENHRRNSGERLPITQRVEIFGCSCCPPNLNRMLSSVGQYIFGYDNRTLFINQFASCELEDDNIKASVKTNYPCSGKIEINASGAEKIAVRIPQWCNEYEISEEFEIKDGYAYISCKNMPVTVDLKIKPALMEANANVRDSLGKAALTYGPFVYCAEGADNDNVFKLYFDKNLSARSEYNDFFGADVLYVKGFEKISSDELYSPLSESFSAVEIKMIPYFGFANREETDMKVFMQYR